MMLEHTSQNTGRTDVADRLTHAIDAVAEAAELTLGAFWSRDYSVDRKGDGTVVTEADRNTETLLRTRFRNAFPADGLLGEEHGHEPGSSGFTWIIDPIDGTTSFVHGVPLFGTLIGLEKNGRIEAGVISMPALSELVYASRGQGAWHVRRGLSPVPARVSDVSELHDAMMITTSYHYFSEERDRVAYGDLCRVFGDSRGWSDCYAHVLVATGRADVVIEPLLSPWDIAPMSVILDEAGGRCSNWEGVEDHYSPTGVSSNGLLHDQVLEVLRTRTRA